MNPAAPLAVPGLMPTRLFRRRGRRVGMPRRPARNLTEGGPIALGDPGTCPGEDTTLYAIFDKSMSVAGTGGNDPLSRRYEEAAIAIDHVARACRCRRDRVALLSFDVHPHDVAAPHSLTRGGVALLHRRLRDFATEPGLSSDLLPALTVVERHAERHQAAAAVVVFSDFLLTDDEPDAVLERLCRFPGFVHAVVLGAAPPPKLRDQPDVAVTSLTLSSPRGATAQALAESLAHYRGRQPGTVGGAL